jgi:bacillolysin
MNKQLKSFASLVFLSMFSAVSYAQISDKNVSQKQTSENGTPSLITFNEKAAYKSSGSKELFKTQLGLKENQSFSRIKTETDKEGFSHEKFQLYHEGIKVEFATYSLHSKNGKISSMSGEFYKIDKVDTKASISPQTAFNKAIAQVGAKEYLWQKKADAAELNYQKPTGELVLLPSMEAQGSERKSDDLRLAYKFDIYATNPTSRGDFYIDAKTGEVLYYNATIKHLGAHSHGKKTTKKLDSRKVNLFKTPAMATANAATRYSGAQTIETTLSGSSYVLSDLTRGNGVQTYNSGRTASYPTTNFTDADNNWTATEYNNANKDNGALDAHWGAEKTYDYWKEIHGRNSFNNAGAKIKSYVHYNLVAAGQPSNDNAFWDGSVMTYGDGSGNGGFDILTALDVCGHEIGHAVCTNTANLAYQKESGAMNEGFSDIWAACIEYHAAPNKGIWLIGEDINRRSGSTALRSMSNPNDEGQPDTYGGTFWKNVNCTPSRLNDFCGVHTNSGVLNYWFYLLSVGKSGTNDKGNVYNVSGITIEKAEKIAFRLEDVYLSANSTFANARTGSIQAAKDLFGADSPEVISTTNAWYAVGVGAAYEGTPPTDTTAPSTPTNLIASGTTSTTTNLSWTASTDNVGVTGYNVYLGTTLVNTIVGTSGKITGLEASTTYSFTVKAKDAAGNLSASSNVVSVTTLPSTTPITSYCASKGNNATEEWIDYVALNGLVNTTGSNSGYGNFTNLVAPLPYGDSTITLSAGFRGTTYNEFWAVWVDFNKNGIFEASEKVESGNFSSSTNLTGTIKVPTTALPGNTRMRVQMKYNAAPTSCEAFGFGEVEDYTVNIGAAGINGIVQDAKLNNEINTSEYRITPNPVENIISLKGISSKTGSFRIYNLLGQEVKAGSLNQNEVNVDNLKQGVYIFEANDGNQIITKRFSKK